MCTTSQFVFFIYLRLKVNRVFIFTVRLFKDIAFVLCFDKWIPVLQQI